MLVRTMLQEVGCDVGTKRIVWVCVRPEYEILFRLMDGLDAGTERRYWLRELETEEGICDTKEDVGQTMMEVKIAFSMSNNALTVVDE
jgi:hypothetical protein